MLHRRITFGQGVQCEMHMHMNMYIKKDLRLQTSR